MKRILCFGDSNTWGYVPLGSGRRHPEDVRWTGVLQKKLGPGYRVLEGGLCGRTTVYDEPGYSYRSGAKALPCALDICDPLDLVIIMLGSNDVKSIFGQTPEQIAGGMETLVEQVRSFSFGPDTDGTPKILIISPAHLRENVIPTDMGGMFDEEGIEKSKKLAPLYKKLAEKRGCFFLDAAQLTLSSDEDGLHLDPSGHAALAEGVYDIVKKII